MIKLNLPSQTMTHKVQLLDESGAELDGAFAIINSPVSDAYQRYKFDLMRHMAKKQTEFLIKNPESKPEDFAKEVTFDDTKWFSDNEFLAIIAGVEGVDVTVEQVATHPALKHFREQIDKEFNNIENFIEKPQIA